MLLGYRIVAGGVGAHAVGRSSRRSRVHSVCDRAVSYRRRSEEAVRVVSIAVVAAVLPVGGGWFKLMESRERLPGSACYYFFP